MCWTPIADACLSCTGAIFNNRLWPLLVLDEYSFWIWTFKGLQIAHGITDTYSAVGFLRLSLTIFTTKNVCELIKKTKLNLKNRKNWLVLDTCIILSRGILLVAWFLLSFPTVLVWVMGRWSREERNDSAFRAKWCWRVLENLYQQVIWSAVSTLIPLLSQH